MVIPELIHATIKSERPLNAATTAFIRPNRVDSLRRFEGSCYDESG